MLCAGPGALPCGYRLGCASSNTEGLRSGSRSPLMSNLSHTGCRAASGVLTENMGHALLGAVRGARCPHVGLGLPGLSPSRSRSRGAQASPGLPVFSQLTPRSEQGG